MGGPPSFPTAGSTLLRWAAGGQVTPLDRNGVADRAADGGGRRPGQDGGGGLTLRVVVLEKAQVVAEDAAVAQGDEASEREGLEDDPAEESEPERERAGRRFGWRWRR